MNNTSGCSPFLRNEGVGTSRQGGQTVMFTHDITIQWLGWGQGSELSWELLRFNISNFTLLNLIQQSDAL